MIYFCSQKNRRALVLQNPSLNGIDYLEVLGSSPCGKQLALTLLKDARNVFLTPTQISTTGGSTVQVSAVSVAPGTNDQPNVVTITLDQTGDFSTYTLSLVAFPGSPEPPSGFDPQLSSVTFSFKAGCAAAADCAPDNCCPPTVTPAPDINYLAKDYGGFRQVMLDRLATLVPAWTETHVPDIGIAIVETLAYAADHLSYQQDAVSTEAYLGTARSRISLRRHARLVDYQLNEGSNGRAWVAITVAKNIPVIGIVLAAGTLFYVRVPGLAASAQPGSPTAQQLQKTTQPVFAAMQQTTLYTEQNEMDFYTWSDSNCCLPSGATEATLSGNFTSLEPGSVLLFEEVAGPNTGNIADADPTHRWVVRLTQVEYEFENAPLLDPLTLLPITRVWWAQEDALPFPLCISSTYTNPEGNSIPVPVVSVARGNMIPADQGIWQPPETLPVVPAPPPSPNPAASCSCSGQPAIQAPRSRYYPQLQQSPLTFALPLNASAPASEFLQPPPSTASPQPQIQLQSDDGTPWTILEDLLSSDATERVYVAEIEYDGIVFLRFGDDQYGMAPAKNQVFTATYRVGNGSAGNIGRDTLAHVITPINGITAVRNPLAATGGVDSEDMEHIRQYAPFSFQTQLRAVTEDDYGTQAETVAGVREARGTFRWTGSWYTAFTSVDPTTTQTPLLITTVKNTLNLERMMGVDLEVEGADIVGLRIEMEICVASDHFQSDVEEALMHLFIAGNQCSGQPGLLNPDNFTFGQTVYASPLVAAAQAVEGVVSATLTIFERMDDPSLDGVAQGYLTMGRLEIARCDNDPNRLDLGIFVLHMDGGK
jgi:uncharacterized phage protein gp47/JayE